jgi:hypothetical protein
LNHHYVPMPPGFLHCPAVVVLGWRLSRLADALRENRLAAVGKLPKRYADLDRNKPFVASITITPIAKQWGSQRPPTKPEACPRRSGSKPPSPSGSGLTPGIFPAPWALVRPSNLRPQSQPARGDTSRSEKPALACAWIGPFLQHAPA